MARSLNTNFRILTLHISCYSNIFYFVYLQYLHLIVYNLYIVDHRTTGIVDHRTTMHALIRLDNKSSSITTYIKAKSVRLTFEEALLGMYN